jgi:hypothetical protein
MEIGCKKAAQVQPRAAFFSLLRCVFMTWLLFQGGVDRIEHVVQVAAKTVDRNNDGNGDTGRDQAVFDRRSTGFIGEKSFKNHPDHFVLWLFNEKIKLRIEVRRSPAKGW